MFLFTAFIGFFLMALGIFLILSAFHKDGCGWLVFGVIALLVGMAFSSYCFQAVIAGGVFGALLFAVIYFSKGKGDD